jgi:hypothetical protein
MIFLSLLQQDIGFGFYPSITMILIGRTTGSGETVCSPQPIVKKYRRENRHSHDSNGYSSPFRMGMIFDHIDGSDLTP